LFRCIRIFARKDKIHTAPVKYILMATSSSTTFGGPPSPLEKAIRDSSINQNLKYKNKAIKMIALFFNL